MVCICCPSIAEPKAAGLLWLHRVAQEGLCGVQPWGVVHQQSLIPSSLTAERTQERQQQIQQDLCGGHSSQLR